MAQGARSNYHFIGNKPVEIAASLEEALRELNHWWQTRPSLVVHEMGNLLVSLSFGNLEVDFEVTNATALNDLRYQGPVAFIDYLAKHMGIPEAQAREILESGVTQARVEVSTIRVPGEPDHWSPDPGLDVDSVMPEKMPDIVRELAADTDVEESRVKGRPRSKRGRELLRIAVLSGQQQKLSIAELSRRTGIPRSTLRDERGRMEKETRVRTEFKARKSGQRLTVEQQRIVREELKLNKDNAAATARQLGIAERTVRDLRQREKTVRAPRKTYTPAFKNKVINLVKKGMTASEAGRKLGVPTRTARGWVHKARFEDDD